MTKLPWLFAALFLTLAACSSDDGQGVGPRGLLVGASCDSDRHCDSRCVKGKHYPGGMCTISCRDDRDCPGGTFCVDDHGGICALGCHEHRHCGSMGDRYGCHSKSRAGHKGKAHICRAR